MPPLRLLPHPSPPSRKGCLPPCATATPPSNVQDDDSENTQNESLNPLPGSNLATPHDAPATWAILLFIHTPNSFLPQYLCTCCSFCQNASSPRSLTRVAPLYRPSLSCVTPHPQQSSPLGSPALQPPTATSTFQVCLSSLCFNHFGVLFIPT